MKGGDYLEIGTVLDVAVTQGVWAVLFITMLGYVLKENNKREDKYQDIIDNLTDRLKVIENLGGDIAIIKKCVWGERDAS